MQIHLWEICGKQVITPIARQAADLTEGTSSFRAALIYKDMHKLWESKYHVNIIYTTNTEKTQVSS